jgi:hypothetical protein
MYYQSLITRHFMSKEKKAGGAPDDVVEILQHLLKHMDERFDQVDARFQRVDDRFDEVFTRLDRIEFLLSAQERRISILEDRMRVVAIKLGLEFRQAA